MHPPDEKVEQELSEATKRRHAAKRRQQTGQYIKGPIPLPWICEAARLPGKALVVALAVYYRAGIERKTKEIAVPTTLLERFGVTRCTGYRALAVLESARLLSVDRQLGRCPRVTILEWKPT